MNFVNKNENTARLHMSKEIFTFELDKSPCRLVNSTQNRKLPKIKSSLIIKADLFAFCISKEREKVQVVTIKYIYI